MLKTTKSALVTSTVVIYLVRFCARPLVVARVFVHVEKISIFV